jgi:hypothetical protein
VDEPHREHGAKILDLDDAHRVAKRAPLEHPREHHSDAMPPRDERQLQLGAAHDDAGHERAAVRGECVAEHAAKRAAIMVEHPGDLREILEAHAVGEREVMTGDDRGRTGRE